MEKPPLSLPLVDIINGLVDDGTPVTFEATQVTPWSMDDRWTVLQDENGLGIWVDAEFWSFERPAIQQQGTWFGEVRDQGRTLRMWTPPENNRTQATLTSETETHGAIIDVTLTTLEPPNQTGERTSESFIVDDRFVTIEDWEAPVTTRGAILHADSTEDPRLCPF